MKKSILIGLGLAVSVASTAIAQGQGQDKQDKQRGERGKARGAHFEGRGSPDGLLLKGITLTEGQRTQIAQLRKTQREELDAKRNGSGAILGKLREAHVRGDTAAIRVAKEERRAVLEQERMQNIAAIRNILTAGQRVQFDKNVAQLKSRDDDRDRGDKKGGGR